jgi:hypothetical protein
MEWRDQQKWKSEVPFIFPDMLSPAITLSRYATQEIPVCYNPHNSSEIPALLESWVTNTSSVKILCPQKQVSPYIFTRT